MLASRIFHHRITIDIYTEDTGHTDIGARSLNMTSGIDRQYNACSNKYANEQGLDPVDEMFGAFFSHLRDTFDKPEETPEETPVETPAEAAEQAESA